MFHHRPIAAAIAAACACAPGALAATTLNFGGITNNSDANTATGEQQITVDVLEGGGGVGLRGSGIFVDFTFHNAGPVQSTITDIFFDDGSLLGISSIDNSDPGVSYVSPSNQNNLPGGEMVGFFATAGFSAEPTPPPSHNGVDPGETLVITFELQFGKTFADVLDELTTGALRIGVRVQNFPDDGSESLVNLPLVPLPTPAGLALLGFAGLAVPRPRRR